MKKNITHWWLKVRAYPVRFGIGALVALFIIWQVFGGNGNGEKELLTVVREDFVQEVSASGKVVAGQVVDLAFPEGGRVDQIYVSVGDEVVVGQPLAQLSMGTLLSDLRAAEANVALRRAQSRSALVNVENLQKEQDTLVDNAYRRMLTAGITAVLDSGRPGAVPPQVFGLYNGPEGEYTIRIEQGTANNQYRLRVYGIETIPSKDIFVDEPVSLGTHGLYISFTEPMGQYVDSFWRIAIPNTKSTAYAAQYEAYREALQTRDRVLAQARAELDSTSGTAVLDAQIAQAEAEVARINAAIQERILRAPFSGVITAVDVKVGGTTSSAGSAVSLMAADTLQIESYIPEIHVSLIERGDRAVITLDAYGSEVPFEAEVISIDPAETVRDGVSTYRTILAFAENDDRIKAGMTANVLIVTEEKGEVLVVPQGVVEVRGNKRYVQVYADEKVTDREVTVGGISSRGSIEILSGLSEGEVVVSPR